MKAAMRRIFRSSDGQSVVEYGLLISLIVLVVVTMFTATRGQLGAIVSTAAITAPR
jgi:Flp pilus assembly pilin Flp